MPVTRSSPDLDALTFTPPSESTSTAVVKAEVSPAIAADAPCNPAISQKPTLRQEVEIFFSTFTTIFVAELGDKTQVTTLLMSAQSQAPWIVFVGAGAALVMTSLLGVLLGRWIANRVCPKLLQTFTGALLLLISVLLLWDVVSL